MVASETGAAGGIALDTTRMQILDAIAAGQISAQEGARLLDALASATERGAVTLHLRVVDVASGQAKVDVRLPLAFLESSARLGLRLDALWGLPGSVDAAAALAAARAGSIGVLAEAVDEVSRQRFELVLERS